MKTISKELFEKAKAVDDSDDIKKLLISSGEVGDNELSLVSVGACSKEAREEEKGLRCPECKGTLIWDYDTSWTTAHCTKCRSFFVYSGESFIKVE